ncbi:MAG: hypothetical protein CVT68_04480, partial [Actinobacteria bacterium HGW-Actinobacteria-8]
MSFRVRPGRIGVVGGGTSAWLTALALKEWRPELAVTVLPFTGRDGAVLTDGAVGDGLATRPSALPFLHGYLGLDPHALHREVRPAWNLGVRYAWGRPEPRYDFDLAFGEGNVAEALACDGGVWRWSLTAQLMAAERAPLARLAGQVHALLAKTPLGYLAERAALIAHLAGRAAAVGVRLEPRPLLDAQADGAEITGLTLAGGEATAFDLYVDASGPRALLLEALGVPWLDAALPCDAVVTGTAPAAGAARPHATLTTLEAGYLWTVPTRDRVHHAYVHASGAASASAVEAALREAAPGIGSVHRAPLRSGRRAELVRGNVVAVGTSYGAPEPLLLADTHLEILHISRLLALLTSGGAEIARVNAQVAERWDAARDLAALQYRLNSRLNSDFWRDVCGAHDRRGAAAADELSERGLWSARGESPSADPGLYGAHGLDALLTGLGVRPAGLSSGVSAVDWASLAEMRARVAEAALPP